MKPRTKFQIDIMAKSAQLYSEEHFILEWAKVECFPHIGFSTKNRIVCMDCGGSFSSTPVKRKHVVCPHCLKKLDVSQSRNLTLKQHAFVGYAQVIGEYQVIRYFEIFSHHKAGKKTKYFSSEILQHWIRDDGSFETVARNRTVNLYVDSWSGSMAIRKDYRKYYRGNKYDVYTEFFHPQSTFKKIYTKVGINRRLAGMTVMEAVSSLPSNPKLETILKAKQFHLLSYFNGRPCDLTNDYWTAIKICIRNKHIVKDAKMWIDYIDLLSYFGKDLHNAHYVCPKKLKREHDKYVIKKRMEEKKIEDIVKREKAQKENAMYIETKKPFLGLAFGNDTIQIKVLESLQEFMQEGDIMHHCVFTNKYYSKPDSLVLSARINDVPIETIEVSISNLSIEQSRGRCNRNTKYHDKILELVNRNMFRIEQCLNAVS